jgi:hypothetical protein
MVWFAGPVLLLHQLSRMRRCAQDVPPTSDTQSRRCDPHPAEFMRRSGSNLLSVLDRHNRFEFWEISVGSSRTTNRRRGAIRPH